MPNLKTPEHKIDRAIFQASQKLQYNDAEYEFTPEFFKKLTQSSNIELVHNSHEGQTIGTITKLKYCPEHGLYGDFTYPNELDISNAQFSTDLNVDMTSAETTETGYRIHNGELNKVVIITDNGIDPRDKTTRLCNIEKPKGDDPISEERIRELENKLAEANKQIGTYEQQIELKDQEIAHKDSRYTDLETKYNDGLQLYENLKTEKSTLETNLSTYTDAEEAKKEEIIKELAGDNETMQKAYKSLSIEELKEMNKTKKLPDTPPKGAKPGTAPPNNPEPKDDDAKAFKELKNNASPTEKMVG